MCVAHPVQGLVCAHGYADSHLKTLPVETVFAAIAAFQTRVHFDLLGNGMAIDIRSNGRAVPTSWASKISAFTGDVLAKVGHRGGYRVRIRQNFPSAIGVGSSAAIFAALTRCLVQVVGGSPNLGEISALARLGSYSAAAAVSGEISAIRSGNSHEANFGEVVCPKDRFPFQMLVLPVRGEKQSADIHADMPNSLYYEVWLREAQRVSGSVVRAFTDRNWVELAAEVEHYIYANLGAISTGPRNLVPWRPGTLLRLSMLAELRKKSGLKFFVSMNSGPAVFVYAHPSEAQTLIEHLRRNRIACVLSEIGSGVRLCD